MAGALEARTKEPRLRWHSGSPHPQLGSVGGADAAHYCDRLHRIYTVDCAEIVWTEPDRDVFNSVAPHWARRVWALACETGLRPSDLVRLTRANVERVGGVERFRVRTQKRGRIAHIPLTPALQKLVESTPADQLLLLVNDRRNPINALAASRAITRSRQRIAERLSNVDLRLQDTRSTAATRLLRAGLSLNQIANHMGWSPRYASGVIEHYTAVSPAESAEVLRAPPGGRKGHPNRPNCKRGVIDSDADRASH